MSLRSFDHNQIHFFSATVSFFFSHFKVTHLLLVYDFQIAFFKLNFKRKNQLNSFQFLLSSS